jgi:hypothetical protein
MPTCDPLGTEPVFYMLSDAKKGCVAKCADVKDAAGKSYGMTSNGVACVCPTTTPNWHFATQSCNVCPEATPFQMTFQGKCINANDCKKMNMVPNMKDQVCQCSPNMWWAVSEGQNGQCISRCPSARPVEFKANHTCIQASDCANPLSVSSGKCVCPYAKKWSTKQ